MALLSPTDQQRLRESFAELTSAVRLLFFTQTIGCETCLQTRQILDELPALSDKITIEEVNVVLDPDKAKQHGIDRAPAVAVFGEYSTATEAGAKRGSGAEGAKGAERARSATPEFKDSRIRFLGAPAGYEFISLVQAVLLVGGRDSNLSEENRQRIARVEAPLIIQVFTTPT